jgi:uncharacterized protein with gpF-like domain
MFSLFGKKKRPVPLTIYSAPEPQVADAPKAPVKHSMPTVKFDASRVTPEIEAEIRAVINETPEIPESERETVYQAALGGVRRGGDLHTISLALLAMPDVDLSKARVGAICRYIDRRASALMDRNRQLAIGITEATWLYSGSPCHSYRGSADEDEAQDAAHKAANGKRFKLSDGMKINGRFVLPGQDAGCKCVSKAIIPGLD